MPGIWNALMMSGFPECAPTLSVTLIIFTCAHYEFLQYEELV